MHDATPMRMRTSSEERVAEAYRRHRICRQSSATPRTLLRTTMPGFKNLRATHEPPGAPLGDDTAVENSAAPRTVAELLCTAESCNNLPRSGSCKNPCVLDDEPRTSAARRRCLLANNWSGAEGGGSVSA
uniref:Uncharacterized protein n=1 Tax=Oryza sativa subsp. japonica TaxID=39947 RepID=Q6Z3Q9_ORYSJ|nr:hypothetical protein [Oryza sativa Japonica Group]